MAGWIQALIILGAVVALHVPLGDYMARVYTSAKHSRAERLLYRVGGVNPDAEQTPKRYLLSVLLFSAFSIAVLFVIFKAQAVLPLSRGLPGFGTPVALHTAISFTTNASWQNFAPESALGHLGLMAGMGTQAFASAAVGMAVALALVRGLVRHSTDRLGNFWVDLVRSIFRVLLPLSVVSGLILLALGVPQSLSDGTTVTTLGGAEQTILGGPAASWEPIKLMSGDGGGIFSVSSAHPLENPSAWTNSIEIILMLLVPTAFLRTYGRLVGSRRHGWALFAVVAVLFGGLLLAANAFQSDPSQTVPVAVGGAVEGTETRVGVSGSSLFGVAATASADGAVNSSYDSFTSLGGGILLAGMLLGEVSPGGTGSGLYGLLMVVLVASFLGGLMVGRTPEYLRKRITQKEMRFVVLYQLVAPTSILVLSAIAVALPVGRASMGNPGPHGLTEIIYGFTSNVNSNGSSFAGLNGATTFYNLMLSAGMLAGRYLTISCVVALAGALARQRPRAATEATLKLHGVTFVVLVTGAAILLAMLNYLPALSLGPLAEGFH